MATYTNIYPAYKWNHYYALTLKVFSAFILLLSAFFSTTASAQTIGESKLSCDISRRNPCTSKDLSVVDVFIEGVDECTAPCTSGETVTKKLYMTINNGTKSERTSFALYGTLSNGAYITFNGVNYEKSVFVCVGPITVKSDQLLPGEDAPGNQTFLVGNITYTCGQELSLSNNFLAWTDAAGTTSERCSEFMAATKCSDIAPKCGTDDNIVIRTPLTAAAATVTKPCEDATTGGSISVTPSGGLAPYDIVISKKPTGNCPTTAPTNSDPNFVTSWTDAAGAVTTTETLGDYTYCIYVTDANGCTYNFSYAIEDKPCCVTPPKPTVCEVPQSNLCPETGGVTIKVSNLQANAYYIVTQGTAPNFTYSDTIQATGGATELTFTGLETGKGFTVYGEDRTSTPYCKSASTTCADNISPCATTNSLTALSKVEEQTIKLVPQNETKVLAAPNPFNDRIRFTLESGVSGQGSLELYNMLGQRVRTVFQGYVKKGEVQSIEYNVPRTERSNLIYVFRVGEERVSGKLIGVKQ